MTHSHPTRMKSLTRMFSLVLAASVAVAVLAPAAFANHVPNQQAPKNVKNRHFLKMYKVEKVFDIEEDEYVHDAVKTHVFCNQNCPGAADDDYALDGMWKVVDVDQDDFGGRPYQDIKVYASYSDAFDRSKWHFEVENRSDGRAQLKFYATCLGYQTEPNSHRHSWHVTDPIVVSINPGFADEQFGQPTPNERHIYDTNVDACPTGYIAVSPGFQWKSGYGDLYKSHYRTSSFRDWQWGFWVEPGSFNLDVSIRCLRIRTDGSGHGFAHFHKLLYDFHPNFAMLPDTGIGGGPDHVETRTRACSSHEKGMVHSFDLDPDLDGQYLWFLGMDPRIKKRAYKVLNEDAMFHNAKFGLMCFNDRTGKRKRI